MDQIGSAALLVDQKQAAEYRQKRRDADNRCRAVQCADGRQVLDQDAAEQRARDGCDVEP